MTNFVKGDKVVINGNEDEVFEVINEFGGLYSLVGIDGRRPMVHESELRLVDHFSDSWNGYIPDGINKASFFSEMAEINVKYNEAHNIQKGRFRVCVFEGREGSVPHVHVFYKGKTNKKETAYIRLDIAEYAPQHKDETKILNSDERKALQSFFEAELITEDNVISAIKDKHGDLHPMTSWYDAVNRWISHNPKSKKMFNIDDKTGLYQMPDYRELKKGK